MEAELRRLLNRLEQIGERHAELFDSDVRQAMSNALVDGLARLKIDFVLSASFGMFSTEGEEEVHAAIREFLAVARQSAAEQGLATFHQRLAAIQNPTVLADGGNDFDEFFGTSNPDSFDSDGQVIRLN